jgi:hypothetical protein
MDWEAFFPLGASLIALPVGRTLAFTRLHSACCSVGRGAFFTRLSRSTRFYSLLLRARAPAGLIGVYSWLPFTYVIFPQVLFLIKSSQPIMNRNIRLYVREIL